MLKSNAILTIKENEETTPPDSAIIYSKGEKQLYGTICGNYVNHFLHFDTDSTMYCFVIYSI